MKQPKDLSLEEIVKQIQKANSVIDEMTTANGVLKQEVLLRLREMKIDGTTAGGFALTKAKRMITTDVKFSEAEAFGAVKTVIDSIKIKKLVNSGTKIKGIKFIEYLIIRSVNEK